MIAAWCKKAVTPLIVLAALLAAAALLGWLSLRTVAGLVDHARTAAIAERNSYWEGRLEKANAATEKRAADQVREALQIQSTTSETVQSATELLASLKVKNAELPSPGNCGLSAERSRMLPD